MPTLMQMHSVNVDLKCHNRGKNNVLSLRTVSQNGFLRDENGQTGRLQYLKHASQNAEHVEH